MKPYQITCHHEDSTQGDPVILKGGKPMNPNEGLREVMAYLELSTLELGKLCGYKFDSNRSCRTIVQMRADGPVPAKVLNMLATLLDNHTPRYRFHLEGGAVLIEGRDEEEERVKKLVGTKIKLHGKSVKIVGVERA